MSKANFILTTGAVVLLSGCSSFSLGSRSDDLSSRDIPATRTSISTKYPNNPRNVIAPSARSKEVNPRQGALVDQPTTSSPPTTGTLEDAKSRAALKTRGVSEPIPRSYVNEEVASSATSTGARQVVVDPGQLNHAPATKYEPETPDSSARYTPDTFGDIADQQAPVPDRPRLYTSIPNPSIDTFGDIADQRMPLPDRPRLYTFGPTKPGDTLADVANKLVPSEEVTIAQMMWALYRKNPGAFRNKNINSLKPRSLLHVPELDELRAISHLEAETQIARLHGSIKPKLSATY